MARVSSAKDAILEWSVFLSMSLISIRNIRGPMTLPCGTPLITGRGDDSVPLTITDCVRFERNSLIHDRSLPLIPKLKAFARTILWSTLSNALAKSRYTTSTLLPCSSSEMMLSWWERSCVRHERPGRNPCWFSFMRLFWSRKPASLFRRIFSKILMMCDVKATGL